MTLQPDGDLRSAIDGELRLLQPLVRRSRADVDALLDPEFAEFGASGRRWSRAEILASLAGEEREAAVAAHSARVSFCHLYPIHVVPAFAVVAISLLFVFAFRSH